MEPGACADPVPALGILVKNAASACASSVGSYLFYNTWELMPSQ
jgi:hypothetical protein